VDSAKSSKLKEGDLVRVNRLGPDGLPESAGIYPSLEQARAVGRAFAEQTGTKRPPSNRRAHPGRPQHAGEDPADRVPAACDPGEPGRDRAQVAGLAARRSAAIPAGAVRGTSPKSVVYAACLIRRVTATKHHEYEVDYYVLLNPSSTGLGSRVFFSNRGDCDGNRS